MKYLIYGDDRVKVSEALVSLIKQIKNNHSQTQLIQFNSEENNLDDWHANLNQTLFGGHQIIKISRLYAGRKTKLKDKIKQLIKTDKSDNLDIIVVEEKMIKNPPRFFDKVMRFKQKVYLFDLLDKIGVKSFDSDMIKILNQETSAYELFLFMILKRLEELMTFKSPKLTAKGFYQAKLKNQAKYWTVFDILNLHNDLIKFDLDYKTGKTKFKDPKLALGLYLFSYQFSKGEIYAY